MGESGKSSTCELARATKSFVRKMPPPSLPETTQFASSALDDLAAALAIYGQEAGQYNVLGPDPWQVIWNDDRSGFINFLESRRCLLTWRSPVASVEEQPGLLARLADYSERVHKPLFCVEVSELTKNASVALGMTAMWVGTESFIDLSTWSVSGGKRKKVRWARSHATSLGLWWREASPWREASDEASIRDVEAAWKHERPERRTDSFLRTDFAELSDVRRYFICDGPNGVVAFVTCTPVSDEGWYLQDIVRRPNAPRGALEGAMAFALDTLRDDGFAFATNGPLPFWIPYEGWSDPDQLGALGQRVFNFFDRRYRFLGINTFRPKFTPDRALPLYLLRSRRLVSPIVARSLTHVLNRKLPGPSDTPR